MKRLTFIVHPSEITQTSLFSAPECPSHGYADNFGVRSGNQFFSSEVMLVILIIVSVIAQFIPNRSSYVAVMSKATNDPLRIVCIRRMGRGVIPCLYW